MDPSAWQLIFQNGVPSGLIFLAGMFFARDIWPFLKERIVAMQNFEEQRTRLFTETINGQRADHLRSLEAQRVGFMETVGKFGSIIEANTVALRQLSESIEHSDALRASRRGG